VQIHEAWSYGVQSRCSAKDLHQHFDTYLQEKLNKNAKRDDDDEEERVGEDGGAEDRREGSGGDDGYGGGENTVCCRDHTNTEDDIVDGIQV
jgi:hypothetical protein